MISDQHQKSDEEPLADVYEPPRIEDLGALRELTLGNKNAPRTPDGSFGFLPVGSQ